MADYEQDQDFIKDRPLEDWQKELVDKWSKLDLPDLCRKFAEIRREKDDLDQELKDVNWKHDYIRLVVIVAKMEERGISTETVMGVGRVTIQGDLYARIPKLLRVQAYDWLRDNGHEGLITETVNPSTLKAAAKEMIKKGEEIPENLIKITPFSRAQLTVEKPKA